MGHGRVIHLIVLKFKVDNKIMVGRFLVFDKAETPKKNNSQRKNGHKINKGLKNTIGKKIKFYSQSQNGLIGNLVTC